MTREKNMAQKKNGAGGAYPRRDFLRKSAATAAGLSLLPLAGAAAWGVEKAAKDAAPRVCLVRSGGALSPDADVSEKLGAMLDEAIKFVTGTDDPADFWNEKFGPEDKVAVKVSAVIPRELNFGPQIAAAMVARLAAAGVKEDNITFFERETKTLKRAGYRVNVDGEGVRCHGNDEAGYSDKRTVNGSFKHFFSRILEESTALINMPILKTHDLAGISVALKNHYGSFDKPWECHAGACDPYIADLNASEPIAGRHRIVICDAMRPLYAGGPAYNNEYVENLDGLLVGIDPVAVDTVGYNLLKKMRKKDERAALPYLFDPVHIGTAAEKGVGEGDIRKIEFESIKV